MDHVAHSSHVDPQNKGTFLFDFPETSLPAVSALPARVQSPSSWKDPGSTGARPRPPAGADPNFAETMYTR